MTLLPPYAPAAPHALVDEPAALAAHVRDPLEGARRRSRGLTDVPDEGGRRRRQTPLMSPLVEDLAHVPDHEEPRLCAAAAQDPLRPGRELGAAGLAIRSRWTDPAGACGRSPSRRT